MNKFLNNLNKNKDLIFAFIVTIGLFLLVRFLWGYFNMPNQEEIVSIVTSFFQKYGLIVIFLAAIIESIILIGGYFPGSLVIFLGVASSSGDPVRAFKVLLLASFGALIGYTIDYFIGKSGGVKLLSKLGFENEINKIKNKIHNNYSFKKILSGAFLFYILPGSGSIMSASFGVLKIKYIKFISFIIFTVAFWNTVWGVLVYHFGMSVLNILTNKITGIILITLIFVYFIYSGKWEEMQKKFEESENSQVK